MTDSSPPPVDLTGKKGVVDPKDLKAKDPVPPKLDGEKPPLPKSEATSQSSNYDVKVSGETIHVPLPGADE